MIIKSDLRRKFGGIIINIKSNDPLTAMDKIKYCLNLWVYNHERFLDFEVEYYKGLIPDKKPHGIDNFYWQKAYKFYSMGIHRMGTGLFTWLSFNPIIQK